MAIVFYGPAVLKVGYSWFPPVQFFCRFFTLFSYLFYTIFTNIVSLGKLDTCMVENRSYKTYATYKFIQSANFVCNKHPCLFNYHTKHKTYTFNKRFILFSHNIASNHLAFLYNFCNFTISNKISYKLFLFFTFYTPYL